jgi:hypothetical protein
MQPYPPRETLYEQFRSSQLFRSIHAGMPISTWVELTADENTEQIASIVKVHFVTICNDAKRNLGDRSYPKLDRVLNNITGFLSNIDDAVNEQIPPMVTTPIRGGEDGPSAYAKRLLGVNLDARKLMQDLLEVPADATTQCNSVGFPKDGPNGYGTPCYICGFEMEQNEPIECEHRAPVFTAGFLSGLARRMTPDQFGALPVDEQQMLQLEYRWSHRCCNRVKLNFEYIAPYEVGGRVQYAVIPDKVGGGPDVTSLDHIKTTLEDRGCPDGVDGAAAPFRSDIVSPSGRRNFTIAGNWSIVKPQIVSDFGNICATINGEINSVFGSSYRSFKLFLLLNFLSLFTAEKIANIVMGRGGGVPKKKYTGGTPLSPVDFQSGIEMVMLIKNGVDKRSKNQFFKTLYLMNLYKGLLRGGEEFQKNNCKKLLYDPYLNTDMTINEIDEFVRTPTSYKPKMSPPMETPRLKNIPSVKRPIGGPERGRTYVNSSVSFSPYLQQGGSLLKKRTSHLKRTHKKRTKKFKRK